MRRLASGIGMFACARSRTPGQAASRSSISRDLVSANGIESSVKTTTPAWPPDPAMTQSAAAFATSSTLVVTFVNSRGLVLGPGALSACQPTSGMPSAPARATCCEVSRGSKPPMTMPEGLRVTAWLSAAWMPAGVPCPSITRTVQPMVRAASRTAFATPATPGLVMVCAT